MRSCAARLTATGLGPRSYPCVYASAPDSADSGRVVELARIALGGDPSNPALLDLVANALLHAGRGEAQRAIVEALAVERPDGWNRAAALRALNDRALGRPSAGATAGAVAPSDWISGLEKSLLEEELRSHNRN